MVAASDGGSKRKIKAEVTTYFASIEGRPIATELGLLAYPPSVAAKRSTKRGSGQKDAATVTGLNIEAMEKRGI